MLQSDRQVHIFSSNQIDQGNFPSIYILAEHKIGLICQQTHYGCQERIILDEENNVKVRHLTIFEADFRDQSDKPGAGLGNYYRTPGVECRVSNYAIIAKPEFFNQIQVN